MSRLDDRVRAEKEKGRAEAEQQNVQARAMREREIETMREWIRGALMRELREHFQDYPFEFREVPDSHLPEVAAYFVFEGTEWRLRPQVAGQFSQRQFVSWQIEFHKGDAWLGRLPNVYGSGMVAPQGVLDATLMNYLKIASGQNLQ